MILSVYRLNLLLLFVAALALVSGSPFSSGATKIQRQQVGEAHRASLSLISVRGGAAEEDSDDDEDNSVGEASSLTETALGVCTRVLTLLGKATIVTTNALSRSIKAAFDAPEDDVEEEASAFTKVLGTLQRMWRAAMSPPESEDEVATSATKKSRKSRPKKKAVEQIDEDDSISDFGQFLSKQYDVTDAREEYSPLILGCPLADALREARTKARLLVAFIPASGPAKNKKSPDHLAVRSLLSAEVSKAADKRSRKSAETGSFVLWGAKAGSPEAIAAMKRLKAKQPKGEKRPTLLVAYPAQVFSPSGVPKLVPKLLAQHHCSPPPSPESMAAWLNALRKRHSKQFAAMQHDLKEAHLYRERQEGYKSSIQSDVQRKEDEKKAEAERVANEKAEQERLAALEERREELKDSLPDEPAKDATGAITIALRFADGRAGQRRFDASTPLTTVFNWVDALYGLERERINLTTMNGQKTFSWDDIGETTLKEAGLGRMTGLRVMEKQAEEEITEKKAEEEDDTDENEDEEDGSKAS